MESSLQYVTPFQRAVSSCVGALFTSLLTTPFDVVKIRLQTQQYPVTKPCYIMDCRSALDGVCICTIPELNAQVHHLDKTHIHLPRFTGTADAFIKLTRQEGVASLWKGLSPTLLMAVPATVIYYTSYDQLKMKFGFRPGERNVLAPLLAGSLARTAAVTAICPIELVRTKLQSRTGYSYTELLCVVRNAVAQNGVASLWRGLGPMLMRDIPFSMIYWIGYEELKLRFSQNLHHSYESIIPFMAGSIAGGFSAAVTTPLDVVKTHMQVEIGESRKGGLGAGNSLNVMRNVVQRFGISGLFTGFVPRCAKIAPACAITIGSYETCKRLFAEYNSELLL